MTTSQPFASWRRLLPAVTLLVGLHAGESFAQNPASAHAPAAAATQAQTQNPVWDALEKTHWIASGSPSAKKVVYVIMDPNCPYCSGLWRDMQPWVRAGKVQVRDVLVGILRPSSPGKAAAVLSAKHPAQALAGQEEMLNTFNKGNSGRLHPNEAGGIAPLDPIPQALAAELQDNQNMMTSLNLDAVPVLIWRDDNGHVKVSVGASGAELPAILGPEA